MQEGHQHPVSLDEKSDTDPLSFNSHIGHFEVGAQNAAFFMADEELPLRMGISCIAMAAPAASRWSYALWRGLMQERVSREREGLPPSYLRS
jgi:hypothetical protein